MSLTPKPIPTSNPSGALIGYNNLLGESTTSEAEKALTPNTWERYRPSSGALTVKWQLPTSASVNYIGIAAHALVGETILVSTAPTVGGALTGVDSITFVDNDPIMLSFDTRTIREVIITTTLTVASEIGIIYAGFALEMERTIYGGHSPINLSANTNYQSVISESGQFLGRNIIRKGLTSSFSWQFLDPDWYRENFNPFVEAAKLTPFFVKWRPDKYNEEVVFGHTTNDIKPTNMGGGHDLMSVEVSVRAHSDL